MAEHAYVLGRSAGAISRPAAWVLLVGAIVWLVFFAEGKSKTSSGLSNQERASLDQRLAAQAAQRAASAREATAAACSGKIVTQRDLYAKHMASRKYWDAAHVIKECAQAMGDEELLSMFVKADKATHLDRINSKRTSPAEKVTAIELLARDYPEDGQPYLPRLDELKARAQQAEVARAAAEKRRQGVTIGMSKEDVLASSWGKPNDVNRSTYAWGTREQWVYGGRNYLYFTNEKLSSIQN